MHFAYSLLPTTDLWPITPYSSIMGIKNSLLRSDNLFLTLPITNPWAQYKFYCTSLCMNTQYNLYCASLCMNPKQRQPLSTASI